MDRQRTERGPARRYSGSLRGILSCAFQARDSQTCQMGDWREWDVTDDFAVSDGRERTRNRNQVDASSSRRFFWPRYQCNTEVLMNAGPGCKLTRSFNISNEGSARLCRERRSIYDLVPVSEHRHLGESAPMTDPTFFDHGPNEAEVAKKNIGRLVVGWTSAISAVIVMSLCPCTKQIS